MPMPLVVLSLLTVIPTPLPRPQGDFVECTRVLRTFVGEAPGDQFGWVSAPVPDVDGDGREELLVGAPFHATGGANAGRVYLFDVARGLELFHADGATQERLGHAVRPAGDIDGDGVQDVMSGGRGTGLVAGLVRVYSGANGGPLHTLRLGAPGDAFGHSIESLGDVDGDGTPDLAIGAPLDDSAGTNAGRVYVVSGADGVTVLHSFTGTAAGDQFGSAVARLGDVDGDLVAELVVGAADAGTGDRGRVYVHSLVTGLLLYPPLAPDSSGAEFGQFFVADVGRANGDAFPDLYVGDFADGNGRGKAYVFDGASGARIRTLVGGAGEGFGIGRALGDLDGDGHPELVLGSWTANRGAPRAGLLTVFGGADGLAKRVLTSRTAGEELGFDAHGLGDIDGDGRPEVVGTAASYAAGRGRVYVLADHVLEPLGTGAPGSGGIVPSLAPVGCPALGGPLTLAASELLGNSTGTLFLGATRRDLVLRAGTFHPASILVRVPFVASGAAGVAGDGQASFPFVLPADPSLVGASFFAQVVCRDPGASSALALTPGLRLTLY